MGVLADFHVLDAAGLERLRGGEMIDAPIQLKRLTLVEMGTLEEILTGCSFESTLDRNESFECDGSEAMVTLLSDDLVAALAKLPSGRIAEVAEKWGGTEELDTPGSELEPILRDLIALAKTVEPPKRLVLWNSP